MVPDLEKPRVTEIQVRIDCNGCVQKIKKALHGINGIYDVYIDVPQQKLTVVGWADPERIVKAIKKTRKIATICSHKEAEPPAPAEADPPAAPQAENPPPPAEAPAPEAAPPAEPAKDPPPPQPSENAAAKEASPPPAAEAAQTPSPSEPKDVEEVHIIHHHPHNYGYSNHWNMYSSGGHGGFRPQEVPYHVVTHSYNTHRPSPYVTEYEYPRSPPPYARNARTDHYHADEYQSYHAHAHAHARESGDGNHITSMFSDENPNACRIV